MFEKYIHNLNLKIGSHYINETLNDEFKKFTFNRDLILSLEKKEKEEFDNFFKSGKINPTVDAYINTNIIEYIKYYIPKYTSCFLNSDAKNNIFHSDSFLFIGIDDDSVVSGIPIHTDTSLEGLYSTINSEINNIINNNIFHNLVPNYLIASCIEPYIYVINDPNTNPPNHNNKAYTRHAEHVMKKNLEKIKELKIKKYNLSEKKHTSEKYIKKMHTDMTNITVGNFKKNPTVIKRILYHLLKHKLIPLEFDESNDEVNKETVSFLLNLMSTFNTDNYDREYEKNMEEKFDLNEFRINAVKYNALGTFLHLQIKKRSEEQKNKVMEEYKKRKTSFLEIKKEYERAINEKNILYYNVETHIEKMTHRNKFIIIKIKFNHEKYNEYKKDYIPHQIKFKNDKDELAATERKFKYIHNRLDPECKIIKEEKKEN
jgi:hypothetical protein